MGLAKILVSWILSMLALSAAMQAWSAVQGNSPRGFAQPILEGFSGLGILLAIPTLVFTLVIGWPTISALSGLQPPWLIPFAAAAVLALLMWALAKMMLPNGWHGVEQALVAYAAALGIVSGLVSILWKSAQ